MFAELLPAEEIEQDKEHTCETLLMCIVTVLSHGLRSGGGVGDVLRKPSKEVTASQGGRGQGEATAGGRAGSGHTARGLERRLKPQGEPGNSDTWPCGQRVRAPPLFICHSDAVQGDQSSGHS